MFNTETGYKRCGWKTLIPLFHHSHTVLLAPRRWALSPAEVMKGCRGEGILSAGLCEKPPLIWKSVIIPLTGGLSHYQSLLGKKGLDQRMEGALVFDLTGGKKDVVALFFVVAHRPPRRRRSLNLLRVEKRLHFLRAVSLYKRKVIFPSSSEDFKLVTSESVMQDGGLMMSARLSDPPHPHPLPRSPKTTPVQTCSDFGVIGTRRLPLCLRVVV